MSSISEEQKEIINDLLSCFICSTPYDLTEHKAIPCNNGCLTCSDCLAKYTRSTLRNPGSHIGHSYRCTTCRGFFKRTIGNFYLRVFPELSDHFHQYVTSKESEVAILKAELQKKTDIIAKYEQKGKTSTKKKYADILSKRNAHLAKRNKFSDADVVKNHFRAAFLRPGNLPTKRRKARSLVGFASPLPRSGLTVTASSSSANTAVPPNSPETADDSAPSSTTICELVSDLLESADDERGAEPRSNSNRSVGSASAGCVSAGSVVGGSVLVDNSIVGIINAGPSDAGPSDAGPSDAGPSDAGQSDAGPSDAATIDAGTNDAGIGGVEDNEDGSVALGSRADRGSVGSRSGNDREDSERRGIGGSSSVVVPFAQGRPRMDDNLADANPNERFDGSLSNSIDAHANGGSGRGSSPAASLGDIPGSSPGFVLETDASSSFVSSPWSTLSSLSDPIFDSDN